eukprot:CAMPEP_0176446186 /NCGR_PEP_ID=MMETSP0127-20121128/24168_1 /TAXON_ID=938130 /ORGANISM="Platyophrya macrostoma, Strain WH" /LENGTH=144 /DNA_ID=CAMNT_0017832157 /DNA_START=474 /DNA_END=906 /DNA_ORIENTATION=+
MLGGGLEISDAPLNIRSAAHDLSHRLATHGGTHATAARAALRSLLLAGAAHQPVVVRRHRLRRRRRAVHREHHGEARGDSPEHADGAHRPSGVAADRVRRGLRHDVLVRLAADEGAGEHASGRRRIDRVQARLGNPIKYRNCIF